VSGLNFGLSWPSGGLDTALLLPCRVDQQLPTEIFDIMGRDVTLFHYVVDEDEASHGTQFVESARLWFDSLWDSIARDYRQ
jgi:hypothetical protein